MASLADLFLYKKELDISDPITKKPIKKVWVRVLGDYDLNLAYKAARVASAAKRLALRNPEASDYQDEVIGVTELSREEQIDLIKTSKTTGFISEAQAVVERSDMVKLEEVAIDADAPSLEDLEKLDSEEKESDDSYKAKIQEYVDTKTTELLNELNSLSDEEILKRTQYEVSNVIPFSVFIEELNAYKAFYGTFQDKTCKQREFETVYDFKNLPKLIKDQILLAINELEITGEDVKN